MDKSRKGKCISSTVTKKGPKKSTNGTSIVKKPVEGKPMKREIDKQSTSKREMDSHSPTECNYYEPMTLSAKELRLVQERASKLLKNISLKEEAFPISKPVIDSIAILQTCDPATDSGGGSDFYYDSDQISTIYSSSSSSEE